MEDDGGAGGQRAGPYLAGLPGSAARQHRQALRGRGRASLAGPGSGGGTSSLRATNSRRFLPRGRGQLLARDRRNSPTPCKKPSCRGQGRGWASGAVPSRFRFPCPNCADLAQNVSEPREMGGGSPRVWGCSRAPRENRILLEAALGPHFAPRGAQIQGGGGQQWHKAEKPRLFGGRFQPAPTSPSMKRPATAR